MKQSTSYRISLLVRLLAGIGVASTLTLTGCTEGSSGGDGGAAGSGGPGGGGNTAGTGGGGAGGSGGTTDTSTTDTSTTDTSTDTTTSTMTPAGQEDVERCFAVAAGMACPAVADAAATFGTCTTDLELVTEWLSGPTEISGACCYQVNVTAPNDPSCGLVGRPFMVEGRPRVAPVTAGARGWEGTALASSPGRARSSDAQAGAPRPDVRALDPSVRARLGEAWMRDAAYEHASVASFGKLALELLAFGAPAHLVRAAHEAALDEVRHAELSFALASAYLGRPVGPAALPEARAVSFVGSLSELATAALLEGCFGETVAAVLASAQLAAATDPAVRAALAVIAEEEAQHAELAFRVVAWAVAAGGEAVRAAVVEAFEREVRAVVTAAEEVGAEAGDAMRRHGRLDARETAEERRRAIAEVVVPAVRGLLERRAGDPGGAVGQA